MLNHTRYSEDKKRREYELIEEFVNICPDFFGFTFKALQENPDMIYERGDERIGFDSVIIAPDQTTAECYFDASLCQISVPTKLTKQEKEDSITVFFENKLFAHWRRYSLPTVLVFSLVDTDAIEFDVLERIGARFTLPEFATFNIRDYYLCDGKRYTKIAEK